jgi:hypothetical protein
MVINKMPIMGRMCSIYILVYLFISLLVLQRKMAGEIIARQMAKHMLTRSGT